MPKEYLLTNKLGGYSSSDMQLGNTRKYHGLLVAAGKSLERKVVVNRLLEEFDVDGELYSISRNIYQDSVNPDSTRYLTNIKIDLIPSWDFHIPNLINVNKQIVMVPGRNTVMVDYRIENLTNQIIKFKLSPMLCNRSFHELGGDLNFSESETEEHLLIKYSDNQFLHISAAGWNYNKAPDIYYSFHYPVESERGYPATENLYVPGYFEYELPPGRTSVGIVFEFSSKECKLYHSSSIVKNQLNRDIDLNLGYLQTSFNPNNKELAKLLINQALQFKVEAGGMPSVIAGYHWFGDWGRDTFISFSGLYLATGDFSGAKRMLLRWNTLFKEGLLPNRPFDDDYNSVDAVLWYFVAVWHYYKSTNDLDTVLQIIPNLLETFTGFKNGKYSLKLDELGLLLDTNVGKSATWMDANINGLVVTDRSGYAVEIQMLWYNMLRIISEFRKLDKNTNIDLDLQELISKFEDNFNQKFWNQGKGYLADVIKPDGPDWALRPNQIIGLSLPFNPLDKETSKLVLSKVSERLLTPVGLRTLDPEHPDYKGYYGGDQTTRDHAYHQGTVWPFLLGHYLQAYLQVHEHTKEANQYVNSKLSEFYDFLKQNDLDYVPEIFSANDLRAEGCISQAWSVATILEVITRLGFEKRIHRN